MKIYRNVGNFGSESFDMDGLNKQELALIGKALSNYYKENIHKENHERLINARNIYNHLKPFLSQENKEC